MKVYPLRDINDTLWHRAKVRAANERTNLRAVILRLLAEYIKHGLRPVKE